jgi:aspartyl-tRNA(Asn)/glutamyl-tRNA(Gln) amidotransferase subunit B
LIRAHLEEDAGKNVHDESGRGDSQVDLNRAGTPLLEIVSEPDLRSAEDARLYLEEMRLLLLTIGVSDCNMQEGSLRCDANVNLHIHENGETIPTPIVEIKNLNSFRFLEAAIEYEVKRQCSQWEKERKRLGDIPKTTRGYDPDRGVTVLQRGKEDAADYRYFPCPDLVPVVVTEDELAAIRATLVEFPSARRRRYRDQVGLSAYDAEVIVNQGNEFAAYFDGVVAICGDGKLAANWLTQDVLRQVNERRQTISEFPITSEILGSLLSKVAKSELTIKAAREVFATLLADVDDEKPISKERIDAIVSEKGLATVSDTGAIDAVISGVIARNEKAAADVRAGKQQALGPLVGQVMKELKGADAKVVRQMLLDKLSS